MRTGIISKRLPSWELNLELITLNSSTYSFSEKWVLPRCAHINNINNINFMVNVRVYIYIWVLTIINIYDMCIHMSKLYLSTHSQQNPLWLVGVVAMLQSWHPLLVYKSNMKAYTIYTYKSDIKNNINMDIISHVPSNVHPPNFNLPFLARWTVDTSFSP